MKDPYKFESVKCKAFLLLINYTFTHSNMNTHMLEDCSFLDRMKAVSFPNVLFA